MNERSGVRTEIVVKLDTVVTVEFKMVSVGYKYVS